MERRLFRITWNENDWERPSVHKWSPENQNQPNIAYENQYGYGHEEWMFNPRFNIDGYQYGYIRGVEELDFESVDEAWLYTLHPKTRDRFLVGILKNVELFYNDAPELKKAKRIYKKHQKQFLDDLKAVNADYEPLKEDDDFYFNMRFKSKSNSLFPEQILVKGLRGRRWNRFKPYIIDGDLENILNDISVSDTFNFNPGIAKSSYNHGRKNSGSGVVVKRLHSEITDALVKHLAPRYTKTKENISVEKSQIGNNIADIVLKESKGEISILEVKTSNSTRKNIRDAIGQLLDYALWVKGVKIKSLIIVGPSVLGEKEQAFLNRLKGVIDFRIEYWECNLNKGSIVRLD